ncbi:hypothetical protein L1049_019176 [Liquidambar formosana]|uniref:Uncharacterized protein n=1 Tax=Liquidambar formosana TaxID=63359 RepID=A0AAP0RB56_LIQFO
MKNEEQAWSLFGISLSERPKWQQFLICSSGFFFGYLVNGICEEYVYNRLQFRSVLQLGTVLFGDFLILSLKLDNYLFMSDLVVFYFYFYCILAMVGTSHLFKDLSILF